MALPIAFTVCSAISLLGSMGMGCLDFFAVSEDKEMPKNKKIFRIFTDALTILTQPLPFVGNLVKAPAITKLALNGAAAAVNLTQRVVRLTNKKRPIGWGDYLDLGAGTLIRVSAIVNDALVFKPEFFGSQKQGLAIAADMGSTVGTVVENRTTFLVAWGYVGRLVNHFRGLPLLVVAPDQGAGEPYIILEPEHAETIAHMNAMKTINELKEIPPLFHCDDVLKQFRCALSGKPIRHMLVVAGTEKWEHPIWFESQAIQQKLQERQKPDQWPKDIAFTRKNVRKFPDKQKQIDKALKDILDNIHNSDLRFEPFENFEESGAKKYLQMVALLKAIGLEKINAMQDDEICDAVLAKVSPNTIANVCVNTVWHKFYATEQPKRTKVIRFTPTVTLLGKPPLSEEELFAATRAALISQDPDQNDRRALVLAQIPFEIRVSTDLEDLAICSELVRTDFERKAELLKRMKTVLQVEQLHDLSDDELADKIIERTSKKVIVNVSVQSLAYQFAESDAPKPTRSIIFAPPVKGHGGKVSADSLFAAARSIFGSQSEIDKRELKKRRTFVIYVDNRFQNIDIKEISQA